MTALQDGKPGVFTQLLDRTRISHNTLRLHVERLAKQGLITKEKTRATGLGRPKLAYVIPQRVRRQVSTALSDPFIEIVSLPFSHFRHLCRFEKGGYCKQLRKACEAQNCPKSKNKNENHFTPFSEQACALEPFWAKVYFDQSTSGVGHVAGAENVECPNIRRNSKSS